jgi:ribosome-binding factor A
MVTVTEVNVDKELAFASIYVTATDAEDRIEEILATLKGASSFFRRELAHKIPLRNFPQLRFHWDASQERGARIDELLAMLDLDGEDEEDPSES